MPSLPISLPAQLSGQAVPVNGPSDVVAVLASFIAGSATAPIRDAIVAGLVAMFKSYQDLAAYASQQANILTATGQYLAGLGADRGVYIQDGETDDAYRARILAIPNLVTPAAIIAAVDTILAPYTNTSAQYLESVLDRGYLTDGTGSYHSFIGDGQTPTGVTPQYPDRLYPDDAVANGGVFRPNTQSAGFWTFQDNIGRLFTIRIPELGFVNSDHAYLFNSWITSSGQVNVVDQTGDPSNAIGSFIANGSNTGGSEADGSVATFAYSSTVTDTTLYNSIVQVVEKLKGHSVRWQLYADPILPA